MGLEVTIIYYAVGRVQMVYENYLREITIVIFTIQYQTFFFNIQCSNNTYTSQLSPVIPLVSQKHLPLLESQFSAC